MSRTDRWIMAGMGSVLFIAAGILLWLEEQGRLSDPWPGLAIGCLVAGVYCFGVVLAGYVTRD